MGLKFGDTQQPQFV